MFVFHHFLSTYKPAITDFTLNIPSSVANPNIRQLSLNAGWNGTSKVLVNITAPLINTINLPAGTSFPGGLELYISAGTQVGGVCNGGHAIVVGIPVTINNFGTISGGGGYGGNGRGVYVQPYYPSNEGQYFVAGGFGGQGTGFVNSSSVSIVFAANGVAGEQIYGPNKSFGIGGAGGSGGTWGTGGNTGEWGSVSAGGTWSDPIAGGNPGRYVSGNSFVTWKNTGTRQGFVG